MGLSSSDVTTNLKLERTLAINTKTAIAKAKEDTLEEDEFNNWYLHGDTNGNIGVNDLIWYYYKEKEYEKGTTYSYPALSANLGSLATDWETVFTNALNAYGDGIDGFYPPGETGAGDTVINFESYYLNDNGDTDPNPLTGVYGNIANFLTSVGVWGSGDTKTSGDTYNSSADAIAAAKVFLYGTSTPPGSDTIETSYSGKGLKGRRSSNLKISTTAGHHYHIGIGSGGDTDDPNFYGDSIGDTNGFLATVAYKTNFLDNFLTMLLSGDSLSSYQIHLRNLQTEIININGDSNALFVSPDMKVDVRETPEIINAYLNHLGHHIGDSGDSYYSGGDSTLWGCYTYFKTATGTEADFNSILDVAVNLASFTGDSGIGKILTDRFDSIDTREFGLVGYWPMDEGEGSYAYDHSGNSSTGTLEGSAPTWVDGNSGKAINFPGTDERVDCGTAAPLDDIGNGDFSISFWMKSKDAVPLSYGILFSKYQDATNRLFIRSNGASNQVQTYFQKGGTTDGVVNFNAAPFDTTWHHIVITVNRTTDKIFAYIDAARDGVEGPLPTLPDDASNTGNVSFGATPGGSSPYEGALDDCRIYNRVLTQEDVTALFNYPADYSGYVGRTYTSVESDITKLRKWRLFWTKTRIQKPKATLIADEGVETASTEADKQLDKADLVLETIFGSTLSDHLQFIPTPQMFSTYLDPKRDPDTGVITKRRVGIVYDGQIHTTHYWIYRKALASVSVSDGQWGDGDIYDNNYNTLNEDTGYVKNLFTDEDATFVAGDKYVYRVRVMDTTNTAGGDTTASLQSALYNADMSKSFTTITSNIVAIGDSHKFSEGSYVALSGTVSSDGFYLVSSSGDTTITIDNGDSGTITDTNGTVYSSPSVVFIQE